MKAVTNAGPLVALGKLGVVHLLNRLYDLVLVPATVYREVVTQGQELGQPDAYVVQLAVARGELIVVDDVELASEAIRPGAVLHAGEQAAIELALQQDADVVLLDDQLAREQALTAGLQVKGTLGVIVEANRRRHLSSDEAELLFDAIMERDDIWISEALVRTVREAWRNTVDSRDDAPQ